jgi:hypothetical protein
MRGVNTWRSIRIRSYVLPVLLAALALRFLVPHGFMGDSGDGTRLSAAMCSTDSLKKESIEIPSEPAKPHCDNCLMPSLGPALPPFNVAGITEVSRPPLLPDQVSQVPDAPLARAQVARAPPPHA